MIHSIYRSFPTPYVKFSRIQKGQTRGFPFKGTQKQQMYSSIARSQLTEISRFSEIFSHLNKKTLLLCDLDDTVMESKTFVGSDEWFSTKTKELERSRDSKEEALQIALKQWEHLQSVIPIQLVEGQTARDIRDLQNDDFSVMGLTTRSVRISSFTLKQLKSLNIDFSLSSPIQGEHTFFNPLEVSHKEGILFTAGTKKGEALFTLIPHIKDIFNKVVFINDKATHLADVQKTCAEKNVDFVGLRYGYTDKRKASYDHRLAEIQFWFFEAGKVIPSNQEVQKLSPEVQVWMYRPSA